MSFCNYYVRQSLPSDLAQRHPVGPSELYRNSTHRVFIYKLYQLPSGIFYVMMLLGPLLLAGTPSNCTWIPGTVL